MLLRFACSNFRSIKEKQEILFTASTHIMEHNEVVRTVVGLPKQNVLPVVALYGANASGKSNMLKALDFLRRAVLRSHVDWEKGIDRHYFRLESECEELASSFEVDFVLDGVRYHYGFSCNDESVVEEYLYAKVPGRILQTLIYRKENEPTEFGKAFRLQGAAIKKAGMERNNALIISLILQADMPIVSKIYEYFSKAVDFSSLDEGSERTSSLMLDRNMSEIINRIVSISDIGVGGIDLEFAVGLNVDEGGFSKIGTGKFNTFLTSNSTIMEKTDKSIVDFLSSAAKEDGLFYRAFFWRMSSSGEREAFGISDESKGTACLFNIAGPISEALASGNFLCIDELDSSLHTLLSRAIIRLFMNPETNPKGAQLLFTTHDTNLLSTDVLRRDQVWLTEKDKGGATYCYPLSDFKTKPTDDIEAGYLAGRFGAIPFLPPWRSLIGGEG